jgi:hypothetical protein
MTTPPQDPTAPGRRPKRSTADPEMPILVRPVPGRNRPKVVSTVRVLTGWQVALVMVFGDCSFGVPLLGAITWTATQLNWDDGAEYGIPLAWAFGLAAIVTYAHFTIRWTARVDRRARTTVAIGMAVLVTFTAITLAIAVWWWPGSIPVVLLTAAPSLIIQAIVIQCVYGREGQRWFDSRETARMDEPA